jgi:hypothetical protein
MGRGELEKNALRNHALELVKEFGRTDIRVAADETTGTGQENDFKYMMYPKVQGVVVDKLSGFGLVQVSGGNGVTTKINTVERDGSEGNHFVYVGLSKDQTCMLYGESTVLYIELV